MKKAELYIFKNFYVVRSMSVLDLFWLSYIRNY